MNHKDKVSGHKSSEIFCSLQPNFLASLEFSLNLFSNIFQINTSDNFLRIHSCCLLLKKLHILNPCPHTTSNFRRLMSCWINWYPVDPSQLVPSLLSLLLGNLIFPRRLRLWGNTDFRCGAPGFYPGKTNLCLWRADGDIRHAERTPNLPPDNDPCPTKIAHQMKGREGGHKQFSSPDELLDQLVPSWPQSTRPLPPSTPSRKSYIKKSY